METTTISARVICDSVSKYTAQRITTLEVIMPRIVLAEFNTHRAFSRNSASSRAIPVKKMLDRVVSDPFIPSIFPVDGAGMQPKAYIDRDDERYPTYALEWLKARDAAVDAASHLHMLGVHKQISNRLIEPFMWHTVIVTATDWDNFYSQRDDPAAQYEIMMVAKAMRKAMLESTPKPAYSHLPYITDDDRNEVSGADDLPCISTARCARVSYLNHDGVRDIASDLKLFAKLLNGKHMSPFEHVAIASADYDRYRNFSRWIQYRQIVEMGSNLGVSLTPLWLR